MDTNLRKRVAAAFGAELTSDALEFALIFDSVPYSLWRSIICAENEANGPWSPYF